MLERLASDARFELELLVSRMDDRLTPDQLPPGVSYELVGEPISGRSPSELGQADAGLLRSLATLLDSARHDLLLVLGDRHELLGVALAAMLARVPVVHLHGGEVTEGAIDDGVRHAVTKLAHVHCAATDASAARILGLGEEDWRVHVTGAPGLDAIVHAEPDRLDGLLPTGFARPVALVTYHPPTAALDAMESELDALLAALERTPSAIVTMPGPDPGAAFVVERITRWVAEREGRVLVPNLGSRYAGVLRSVDVVIGNSSSGVVEAPSAGVPVVDIGARQLGRERAVSVLHAPTGADVQRALDTALSDEHRRLAAKVENPYGDGCSAARIVEVMYGAPLHRLLRKRFVDRQSAERP